MSNVTAWIERQGCLTPRGCLFYSQEPEANCAKCQVNVTAIDSLSSQHFVEDRQEAHLLGDKPNRYGRGSHTSPLGSGRERHSVPSRKGRKGNSNSSRVTWRGSAEARPMPSLDGQLEPKATDISQESSRQGPRLSKY